jgi:hypothetical protein
MAMEIISVIAISIILLVIIFFIISHYNKIKLRRLNKQYNEEENKSRSGIITSRGELRRSRVRTPQVDPSVISSWGSNDTNIVKVGRDESASGEDSDSRRKKKRNRRRRIL